MDSPVATTAPSPRPARIGLFGGVVSSRQKPSREAEEKSKDGKKKPKLASRAVIQESLELIKARRSRLALGLVLMGINRASGLILPGTTKFLLDDVIGKGNRELLGWLVLVAGAAIAIQAVTSFALTQVVGKAAQRSITEMRRQVQRHVGRLPVRYYESTKAGALLSRVMNDAEGIRNLVGTGLVEVVGGSVTAVLALGILFYFSAKLTLITLGVMSLFGVIMLYAFKTLRPLFRERSRINAELSGRLTESFSGVRVVKAYQAEQREALVFTKGAHRLFRNVGYGREATSLLMMVTPRIIINEEEELIYLGELEPIPRP